MFIERNINEIKYYVVDGNFIYKIHLTQDELEMAAREYLQSEYSNDEDDILKSSYDKGYEDGFEDGLQYYEEEI